VTAAFVAVAKNPLQTNLFPSKKESCLVVKLRGRREGSWEAARIPL